MRQMQILNFPRLEYYFSEPFNTLCTNLSYCGPDKHVLMFTSRYEQEGKSSIAINVMRTLAGLGKRVLLLDADLRCSTLARRYRFIYDDASPAFGLAQYLAGMCDLSEAIYQSDITNVYVIPAGRDVLNSLQLLASPLFGEMMTVLRQNFDLILVDTPPAGVIVDAVEIAKHCDGAILVVGYRRGRSQDIGDLTESIAKTGCPVLGAVMNGVELNTFRNRNYYYRSEQYSHYYHRYDRQQSAAQKSGSGKFDKGK